MTVSVIIPTRNESHDIRDTIEACLRLEGPLKEVIVVDDSDDDTPDIVSEYVGEKVKLIHREVNRNICCGARIEGIRAALGEVCILLNADAHLNEHFLTQILPHYDNGADYLVVESKALNMDNVWGQYVQAIQYDLLLDDPSPNWSEGFSCRTAVAITVKDWPGDYPVPFCRDYLLVPALKAVGAKGHFDRSIIVEHIVPTGVAHWNNYVYRGTFLAPNFYFIRHRSMSYVAARSIVKCLYEFGRLSTIVWPLVTAVRFTRHLKCARIQSSIISMLGAVIVTHSAMGVGNIKGLWRLCKTITALRLGVK